MKSVFTCCMLLFSIASFSQEYATKAPEWYSKPPTSSRKIYGVGMGTSTDMGIAERKADMNAKLCLAEQVSSVEVIKETEQESTDTTLMAKPSVLKKQNVSAMLDGVKVVEKVFMKDNDGEIVYILLEMKKPKK